MNAHNCVIKVKDRFVMPYGGVTNEYPNAKLFTLPEARMQVRALLAYFTPNELEIIQNYGLNAEITITTN